MHIVYVVQGMTSSLCINVIRFSYITDAYVSELTKKKVKPQTSLAFISC